MCLTPLYYVIWLLEYLPTLEEFLEQRFSKSCTEEIKISGVDIKPPHPAPRRLQRKNQEMAWVHLYEQITGTDEISQKGVIYAPVQDCQTISQAWEQLDELNSVYIQTEADWETQSNDD